MTERKEGTTEKASEMTKPVIPQDEVDFVTGERIAWDRDESDSCERGTPGCSIHHTRRDSECQTW